MTLRLEVVQSTFWATNTGIVTDPDGNVLLVDPGVLPNELDALARRLAGRRVLAAIATHEDWDHVLWSRTLPSDIPRYAHPTTALLLEHHREELLRALSGAEAELSVRWDHDLAGRVIPPPADPLPLGNHLRVTFIPTPGHTPGSTTLWLEGEGILFAGDMLSDVDIPMPAMESGALEAYLASLGTLEGIIPHAQTVVPGHGTPCGPDEALDRLIHDRAYVDALAKGDTGALGRMLTEDPRMGRATNVEAQDDAGRFFRDHPTRHVAGR